MHGPTRLFRRTWARLTLAVSLATLAVVAAKPAATDATNNPNQWPMFGQNLSNTANASTETTITRGNVGTLSPKWVFTTGGDVSARAAVFNNVVYFPDWGGNLTAVNAGSGKAVWQT